MRPSVHKLFHLVLTERERGSGPTVSVLISGSQSVLSAEDNCVPSGAQGCTKKIKLVWEGKVIPYPTQEELENTDRGFAQIAQHLAFSKTVGAIDGKHLNSSRMTT